MASGIRQKPSKTKGKRFYTSPVKQAAVVAAKMAGMSDVKAAETAGVHRETVVRIMSQAEVREAVQRARSGMIELLPDCQNVIAKAVRTKDSLEAAFKVYDGMQVFVPKSQQDANVRVDDPLLTKPREELDYYARTGYWPTEDEVRYYQAHNRWPQQTVDA